MKGVEKTVGYYNETTREPVKDFSGQGWYYKDARKKGESAC
jgi:predicted nucleic acid-binding Zn ribbon protein